MHVNLHNLYHPIVYIYMLRLTCIRSSPRGVAHLVGKKMALC